MMSSSPSSSSDRGPPPTLTGKWKPRKWELFLAGEVCCPCLACWVFFLLGWVVTLAFVMKLRSSGDKIFSFDEQPVKSNLVVQQYYGFKATRGAVQGCADKDHQEESACLADDECQWNNRTLECTHTGMSQCPSPAPPRRSEFMGWVSVIYEAPGGGNLFEDDILGYIMKYEKELSTAANGAQKTDGTLSPWDEDWCQMTYRRGDASSGRCMPPNSLVSLFTMTERGRNATRDQVQEGYTNGGFAAQCLCSHEDDLCAVCHSDGTAKRPDQIPAGVLACVQSRLSANTTPNSRQSADGCGDAGRGPVSMGEAMAGLVGLCKMQPNCQWSPPWTGFCSSTGFYTTDWKGLLTGTEKEAVFDKICNETSGGWWVQRKSTLPQSFDCTSAQRTSPFARSMFFAGKVNESSETPFEAWKDNYIKGRNGFYAKAKQLEERIERESGGKLRIIMYSAATIFSQFMEILIIDIFLSLSSMFMVWAYMWWTLESFFLASCAMFEIVFSLPVALCIWTLIFQQKIIFFQMLVIYMILGIGADDAFIMYDAWMQARFEDDEVLEHWTTRFAHAYRRAFRAMAITTATTCGSFVIGIASPLPMVRDFCIFAAIVVLVDWLFCISFFASAIVVYERYFKPIRARPGQCGGPGCCWGGARAASLALCGGSCVDVEASKVPKKRGMERFCEGPLFELLAKWRVRCILAWIAVVIVGASIAGAKLRTAEKPSPLGREDLDVTRGLEILLSEFSFRGVPTVTFAYGLHDAEPIQEWNADSGHVARYGSAEALLSPEGQKELLGLCRAADRGNDAEMTRCDVGRRCLVLGRGFGGRCPRDEEAWRRQGVYVPRDMDCQNGRYCFMEVFADFWAATRGNCTDRSQQACAAAAPDGCAWSLGTCHSTALPTDYPGLPAAEFRASLAGSAFASYRARRGMVLHARGRGFDVEKESRETGFWSTHETLQFAWVSFNATVPSQNAVAEANRWYSRWEAYRERHGPSLGGFQTTRVYLFMVTQNEMIKAALVGVVLSLLVAYAMLIATTLNWWLATLGLLNILGISVTFLGTMPLLSWSLGENECIFLIAVVGLSVDYTVHLLHSYTHGAGATRRERTKHALAEMGISVTNSALTTLLASTILFGCNFYFFFQFGVFIFFVIGYSILMSIFLLIPLLLLVGPEGTTGRIPCCRGCAGAAAPGPTGDAGKSTERPCQQPWGSPRDLHRLMPRCLRVGVSG